jgi:hypothetical protein
MTEKEFLKLAKAKYAQINNLKQAPNLLDYEKGFVELWEELGEQVAQANLGKQGKDHRQKKA